MFQELVHWDPSRYWDQPRCLVDQGIDPEWKTLWHGSSSYGCFPSLLLAHAIGETVDLLGGSPKGESQHQDQVRLTFYRLTILKFLKMFFNFKNRELRGAIALAFGHLIGVTCGGNKIRPCKTDTINKYIRMAYEAFKSAKTHPEMIVALSTLRNTTLDPCHRAASFPTLSVLTSSSLCSPSPLLTATSSCPLFYLWSSMPPKLPKSVLPPSPLCSALDPPSSSCNSWSLAPFGNVTKKFLTSLWPLRQCPTFHNVTMNADLFVFYS